MFFSFRTCLACAAVLVMPFTALAQDRLVMKNGDVITGNISTITDEDVFIEPSYADEFSVSLADVESINIEETFDVELADSTQVSGQIRVDDKGQQVLIVDDQPRPLALTNIAEATEPEAYFDWGSNIDFSGTYNQGNTDSQTTVFFANGNVKHGDHRHLGDLTLRNEETNGVAAKEQTLFNYGYNWLLNDPWYIGGSFTYERDPIRDLEYRYTAGLIFGRDIFDDARKFMTFTIGTGYSDEEIGGVTESGAVGLWTFRYEHELWGGVDFYHNNNLTQQFYGDDNTILKTNTGFRFDLVDDLYASVSLRYDYETEPAADASKDDSTLAFGLGYSF
jgi:putative salt-induced outer membrane protein YdiY